MESRLSKPSETNREKGMKPVALFVSGDDEYMMQFEENGERSLCALRLKDESFQFEQSCTSTDAGQL